MLNCKFNFPRLAYSVINQIRINAKGQLYKFIEYALYREKGNIAEVWHLAKVSEKASKPP